MKCMCEVLGINAAYTLSLMLNRISNQDLTYGKRLLELIKENGYINTHVELSKYNKKISIDSIKNADQDYVDELKKYSNIALVGR